MTATAKSNRPDILDSQIDRTFWILNPAGPENPKMPIQCDLVVTATKSNRPGILDSQPRLPMGIQNAKSIQLG